MLKRINNNSIGESVKSLLSLPQITSGKPNNKIIFNGLKNKTTFMKYTQWLNSNVQFKINGKKSKY